MCWGGYIAMQILILRDWGVSPCRHAEKGAQKDATPCRHDVLRPSSVQSSHEHQLRDATSLLSTTGVCGCLTIDAQQFKQPDPKPHSTLQPHQLSHCRDLRAATLLEEWQADTCDGTTTMTAGIDSSKTSI